MDSRKQEHPQNAYPLTYQMEPSSRWFINVFLGGVTLFFFVTTTRHFIGVMEQPVGPQLLWMLFVNVFLVAFFFWIALRTNRRVILHEDAIEVAGWLSTRRLQRAEILGRRTATGRGGSSYIIVPRDKNMRELLLPPSLKVDNLFLSWMENIPKIVK